MYYRLIIFKKGILLFYVTQILKLKPFSRHNKSVWIVVHPATDLAVLWNRLLLGPCCQFSLCLSNPFAHSSYIHTFPQSVHFYISPLYKQTNKHLSLPPCLFLYLNHQTIGKTSLYLSNYPTLAFIYSLIHSFLSLFPGE